MGQAAEQIIAGVVLSERLAVTMYGAIHRAQFNGQRNLRGLVVDQKMLAEDSFRATLGDPKIIEAVIKLENVRIVPTVTVEDGGSEVVVVTRGAGRYVTVQDLITESKAQRTGGGRLPLPVAAAIGRAVVEALAAAHEAGVVHGAVHPRSVLVDEDGTIRLADFIVGRALTTAVAQGADSSLWRGLSGYLAPELVVGEDPTLAADVFACGAMLFTMLSGETPPGTLHVTPAVERLVQRALDTDVSRRYKNASDLLENLLEAFEDDRWEIAKAGEVIRAAGLAKTDENIDDATEDLLASLGSSGVTVAPTRPSAELRASLFSDRQQKTSAAPTTGNRLDALLADLDDVREHVLDDSREHTIVNPVGVVRPATSDQRDPISELIQLDPRKKEAIIQVKPRNRVPSLDDPDDDTPLPLPDPGDEQDARGRGQAQVEAAAMSALLGMDDSGVQAAPPRRSRPIAAASEPLGGDSKITAAPIARANLPELPVFDDVPPPRLKSRALGIVGLLVAIASGIGFYYIYEDQKKTRTANDEKRVEDIARAEAATKRAQSAQKDKGSITYTIEPDAAKPASVWLKLGRSGPDFRTSIPLTSMQMHRIRIELPGYQAVDTEVLPANWEGKDDKRKATVNVTLKAVGKDKDGNSLAEPLPSRPPNLAVAPTDFTQGEGPLYVQTNPPGAEVWLLIGFGNTAQPFPTVAGRSYELRALLDGYKPGYASITDDEWRDGGAPNMPIDEAPKKATIAKTLQLVEEPDAPKPDGGKRDKAEKHSKHKKSASSGAGRAGSPEATHRSKGN